MWYNTGDLLIVVLDRIGLFRDGSWGYCDHDGGRGCELEALMVGLIEALMRGH